MLNRFFLSLILLFVILVLAFVVRLYHFSRPVADWHSWRQSDTSSVSRNFVKYGFDILHPKFDDLSKGVSLIDNPEGHRFVEFPIYNVLQAGFYQLIGRFSLEEWGRVITISSQLISIIFLYLLVGKYTSKRAGLIVSAFYAFIPYNVFYGRVLLPDSTTVSAILASVYFFSQWMDSLKSIKYFILTIISTALAFLLKPYALFFMLPHVYLAYNALGFRMFVSWRLIVFTIVSLTPFLLWRYWMQQYPEGIPQSNWLFNGDGIRFKGAFFNWLFAERIGKLILGYFGLPFIILGIIGKIQKEGLLYLTFLISSLIYLSVMAKGNVQHDYYQILIIPTFAIFFGKGVDLILSESGKLFNRFVSYLAIIGCCLFMFAFSWFIVRDFYNLQHVEVITAGKEISASLPQDAKVIAPFGGDTTFLYHINRKGWPVFDRNLYQFIENGATHLAFVNPGAEELDFTRYFEVTAQGSDFVVFNLKKPTVFGKEQLLKQAKEK